MVKEVFTEEDAALLAELGVESEPKKAPAKTAEEERIIAGFEEIQRFVDQQGRLPSMAEGNDIFERIYATRLRQIRDQPHCREVVASLDHQGLLDGAEAEEGRCAEPISDDQLLAELTDPVAPDDDLTNLRHVKARDAKNTPERIANRTACKDFETFKPLFEAVREDIDAGTREISKFRRDAGFLKADLRKGLFFVLGGQMAHVAEAGTPFTTPNHQTDARLRVIFDNGTESDLLLRSLQRALYKDETSRIISDLTPGPLFAGTADEGDTPSGVIYVLQSESDNPVVTEHRDVLHKIGVTGGSVKKRIAGAAHDATFLLADVTIVATYELYNINRTKLEKIIHRFFAPARLDIQIKDRFGKLVTPQEWFLVPEFAVDEAVDKIRDGTIGEYRYDVESARVTKRD